MINPNAAAENAGMRSLHILVVEDAEIDYEFLQLMLRRHGLNIQCRRVETREGMVSALAERAWDLIIADHRLPHFDSQGALEVLRESKQSIPFIIVSGEMGEDAAVAALREGVDDYLAKDRLGRLGPAVEAAIERAAMRSARTDTEKTLQSSQERLSALTAHLENIKEKERAAIARDLHDDIGGALASIGFELNALHKRLGDDPEHAAALTRMRELLDRAVTAMQRMMRSLRPSILDAGLVAALEWLARDFGRRTGIKVTFSSNREELDITAEISTAAFRICQESLTNVLRHAQAHQVRVELFADPRNISIEIHDDGKGVNPDDLTKPGSFGIVGMRERARSLGGWLEVESGSNGTSVMLSLPCRNARFA